MLVCLGPFLLSVLGDLLQSHHYYGVAILVGRSYLEELAGQASKPNSSQMEQCSSSCPSEGTLEGTQGGGGQPSNFGLIYLDYCSRLYAGKADRSYAATEPNYQSHSGFLRVGGRA
eukprot:scaffold641832_cov45-Prasinocladus_malaysianus.AAC.1